MEDEFPKLLPLLQRLRPRFVLLDSYFVTQEYMRALRGKTLMAYIDDQNTFDYPADLVISYTLYANMFFCPQDKCYLLGAKYALLCKEF